MTPGPQLGQILDRLLEAVLEDPTLNHRERLLQMASEWAADAGDADAPGGAAAHREAGGGSSAAG
jgi:hypothetical protein